MLGKAKPCPGCGKPIKSYQMHKQYCTGYALVQGGANKNLSVAPTNNTPKATRSLEELFTKEKELGIALENCRLQINERLQELKLVRANETNSEFNRMVNEGTENAKRREI